MTVSFLREQPDPENFKRDRFDVPLEIRQTATGMSNSAGRVSALLGRQWTTQAGIDQSAAELLVVAEKALELRRLLCAMAKDNEQ